MTDQAQINLAKSSLEEYKVDPNESSFWYKVKANPTLSIGVTSALAMLGHGIYSFKNKGSMPTSIYMIHLRVRTQAMVVGALSIGVAYSMLKDYVFTKKEITEQ